MIKFIDLRDENNRYIETIARVLKSGQFINGPEVNSFEQEVSEYLDSNYSVAVNSGTDALVIALKSLGIGDGHEVITSPFTFVATAEAIRHSGAIPVFADIELDSYNIDVCDITPKITERTRAVLAVNLFGNPSNVVEIRRVCNRFGLSLILDSAQAFGAKVDGKHLNSYAEVTALSFFPTKILGGLGDSGMLITNNEDVFLEACKFRNHGSLTKSNFSYVGYNSRMDEIQAAVLSEKLKLINTTLEQRRQQAALYNNLLSEGIKLPCNNSNTEHVWNIYTIAIKERDHLKKYLKSEGIETAIYYPAPLNETSIYKDNHECPHSRTASKSVLSLPIGSHINVSEIELICHKINRWYEEVRSTS